MGWGGGAGGAYLKLTANSTIYSTLFFSLSSSLISACDGSWNSCPYGEHNLCC